ncbi:sensor histidine kinase [Idiomarina xiamenensis]|uniref:histidine kinase n=1 Tax=Idiomarina xiamenensis 10-D-4 TaxID=740709 RepID=K2KDZ6_9GAMM|nr:ATP-binding protein [Idiomarina xiamenensis]EKE80934.1 PAS/PAC sensor signal transduction histidine kinase [Idiomarina xiamenensis 10-D-4]
MSAIWQRPQVRFWVAVLALLVLSMGLALALVVSYWATATLLSVLLVLAVVGLLNSYQRQRVQLLKFIEQFDESANDRPSQRYLQSLFPELLAVMRQQQQQLRLARSENESRHSILSTLADSMSLALFVVVDNREVTFVNRFTHELCGINQITLLQQLRAQNNPLFEFICSHDVASQVLTIEGENGRFRGLVKVNTTELGERAAKVVSISDIHDLLDQQEQNSWQKLVRVLTHEIMNSIGPITSLAGSAKLLAEEQVQDSDLYKALVTIERRANGLLKFVDNYRGLTQLPKPVMQACSLAEVLDHVLKLAQELASQRDIEVELVGRQPALMVYTDPDLLEHVLLNLVRNGLDAMQTSRQRRLRIVLERKRLTSVILAVEDSGKGIETEVQDTMFMPFFTTKPKGSGIGLALVKQLTSIMSIKVLVSSTLGQGSRFSLVIPLAQSVPENETDKD